MRWQWPCWKGQEAVLVMALHQCVAVQKELHNRHFEVCGLLLWEEAEARILFLWLIDLTLDLLSRICHARSDLLSALFRILFWQHLSKLDFLHILRVYSGNFIRVTQPHSLKRPSTAIRGAVCFQEIPSPVLFPPTTFSWNLQYLRNVIPSPVNKLLVSTEWILLPLYLTEAPKRSL